MKIIDFDYELPKELIAQTPVEPRDSSRLFVVDREKESFEHSRFRDLVNYLNKGDLLVLNETRVIPARLFGYKSTGGVVEILLLKKNVAGTWEVLVGGKGLNVGKEIEIKGGPKCKIVEDLGGSRRRIQFAAPIEIFFDQAGYVPLPPYIFEPLEDPERYQTVYAKSIGSAAAPTAGLHFTKGFLDELGEKGVNITKITLHVGLDTFAPVTEEKPEEHPIHSEWCQVTPESTAMIRTIHNSGGRIVAVGTTSVRAIESAATAASDMEYIVPFEGYTNLFIMPGYQFKLVDSMITNFHLPRSTLLMLVSAFAGREFILSAYQEAINRDYRFYSFGDAMLIL